MALEPVDDVALKYMMMKSYTAKDVLGRVTVLYSNEGIGKSKLAAELGESNCFLADDTGILSLENHPELEAKSFAIPFLGYEKAKLVLAAAENGQLINPRNNKPVDNVVFDTVSGMSSTEIRRSIEQGDIPTENGLLAKNIPTRPHYLLNEQNFGPLMKDIGQMRNCSVTLLSHLRTGTTDVPGASTHPDLHGAAYKLMAKYCSVMGYMTIDKNGQRHIRVMPGEMVAAKTRHRFSKPVLTDEEFISEMLAWKNKNKGE